MSTAADSYKKNLNVDTAQELFIYSIQFSVIFQKNKYVYL